jgi:pimeloyl-ACP methyl ester carboxylesterase
MGQGERVTFKSDGAELVGERWGTGGPVLVFLHAGVCDRRSWYGVIERLDRGGTVLAYDRRGYGETPPAKGEFSHLDDLKVVLEQVTDAPVWLVGSSMGGGLALDCALVAPERLAGMVLLSPSVSGAPEDAELDADSLQLVRQLQALTDENLTEANRLQTWLWLDGPAGPEGRVEGTARELALAMNAIILANEVGTGGEDVGGSGVNAWSRLEEIRAATVVAYGERDLPMIVAACGQIAARIPGALLEPLAGMAHLPYLEDPAKVAALVKGAIWADYR